MYLKKVWEKIVWRGKRYTNSRKYKFQCFEFSLHAFLPPARLEAESWKVEGRRPEARDKRLKAGGRRPEARDWRPKVRGRGLEARDLSWKPEDGVRTPQARAGREAYNFHVFDHNFALSAPFIMKLGLQRDINIPVILKYVCLSHFATKISKNEPESAKQLH